MAGGQRIILISIPEVVFTVMFVNLQKLLSINAPCLFENLMGNVILG